MFLSSTVRWVGSSLQGEPGFVNKLVEQLASELDFDFENAVKCFSGATFRKTRLQYMIMRKRYAYLSGIEGFGSV